MSSPLVKTFLVTVLLQDSGKGVIERHKRMWSRAVASGGAQWFLPPRPPFQICALRFHNWCPVAAYIHYCI